MSLLETLRRKLQSTSEKSGVRRKAQAVVTKINKSKEYLLEIGAISHEELNKLSKDPNQETLYNRMMKMRAVNPEEDIFAFIALLTIEQQTDILRRYADWLSQRYELKE